MPSKTRISADQIMFASDLYKHMLASLRQQRTVTRFVLESRNPDDAESIEFELLVTKIGTTRLPRVSGSAKKD